MHMWNKIFKSIFAVAMTVFALCCAVILLLSYRYRAGQQTEECKTQASWLAAAIESNGGEFLADITPSDRFRVTWISPEGTVLYDSFSDAEELGNHADREEFVQAIATGSGISTRYSDTIRKKTTNYALRLSDGSVLRVSSTRYSIWTMLADLFYPILWILTIAVVLALVLAARVSKSITDPILRLDLSNPETKDIYEELTPLIAKIHAQNKEIQRHMEQIRREHEAQDTLRREFTANVSHELKTPLTSISGTAEIMRSGLIKPDDIPHFAGNIYNESQRLITLVNDILELSRLEDASVPEKREQTDLYTLSRDVLTLLSDQADEHKITLTLEGREGTAVIEGSRKILTDMIYNLCDNAIKYNKVGGLVTVTVAACPEEAVLCVRDTGIGIPQDDIPRIFERFYRVDKSHSRCIGGTGLGLSIVKHGALFHGATVSVDSELSVGSTFTIKFPARQSVRQDDTGSCLDPS